MKELNADVVLKAAFDHRPGWLSDDAVSSPLGLVDTLPLEPEDIIRGLRQAVTTLNRTVAEQGAELLGQAARMRRQMESMDELKRSVAELVGRKRKSVESSEDGYKTPPPAALVEVDSSPIPRRKRGPRQILETPPKQQRRPDATPGRTKPVERNEREAVGIRRAPVDDGYTTPTSPKGTPEKKRLRLNKGTRR